MKFERNFSFLVARCGPSAAGFFGGRPTCGVKSTVWLEFGRMWLVRIYAAKFLRIYVCFTRL